jgi:hypothetical protein
MKIRAEVIAVETHGDTLHVSLQGKGRGDAQWRPMGRHSIMVPATPANGRHYHVGRIVHLEARPT